MEERWGNRYHLMSVQRMSVIDTRHQNWVEKMAQSVKCLPLKLEELSSDPQHPHKTKHKSISL